MDISQFDDIRPFLDDEVPFAILQMLEDPLAIKLFSVAYPGMDQKTLKERLTKIKTLDDFQSDVSYHTAINFLKRSTTSFEFKGFDKLDKEGSYLFISNHRDIVTDVCVINLAIFLSKLKLTYSAIGDNLVSSPEIGRIFKANRSFLINRGKTGRDIVKQLEKSSKFIFHTMFRMGSPVWIAQGEGRAKDGDDKTNPAVLKMISLSRDVDLVDYFKKLKIVPISISYEYDPTDRLKVPELLALRNGESYQKKTGEDYTSIVTGLMGYKGRTIVRAGTVLDKELDEIALQSLPPNKILAMIGQKIDEQIYQNYELWPSNYMAYDFLNQTKKYADRYTEKEEEFFRNRIKKRLGSEARTPAYEVFLSAYAMPVLNKNK